MEQENQLYQSLFVDSINHHAGRILFKGKDIKDESIKERAEKIGIVMQNPNQMISKSYDF